MIKLVDFKNEFLFMVQKSTNKSPRDQQAPVVSFTTTQHLSERCCHRFKNKATNKQNDRQRK